LHSFSRTPFTVRMQQSKPTILIIGGEQDLAQQLRDRIETPERLVVQVDTAMAAWETLRHAVVPYILLHLVLKDSDGKTVLRQLREEPRTAATPVLVIGVAGQPLPADNHLIEPADYVEAPLDIDDIERRVVSRLKRRNLQPVEAWRDTTSGLTNRAAFKESFIAARDRCDEKNIEISVALLVVRRAGAADEAEPALSDSTWAQIGSKLSRSMRAADILARWSRNQVAMLLPGENAEGSRRAAEKACRALAQCELSEEGQPLTLDVKAGVAAVAEGDGPQTALDNADRALWQAAGGTQQASPATESEGTRARRVLIATDQDLTARVLVSLLAKEGIEAERIEDFGTEFELPDPATFGLLILDDVVGGRATTELLDEACVGNGQLPQPLILLVARDADEELIAKALEKGINACVRKPLSPLDLMAGVRKLLFDVRSIEPAKRTTLRLLIVEAATNNLVLAGNALQRRTAFRIYLARGTADGCRRLRDLGPQVVLVDFALRDEQGKPFVEALKEMTDFKTTAIILTAEEQAVENAEDYIEAGVRGVIKKPYNLLSLSSEIDQILNLPAEEPPAAPRATDHFHEEIQRILTMPE